MYKPHPSLGARIYSCAILPTSSSLATNLRFILTWEKFRFLFRQRMAWFTNVASALSHSVCVLSLCDFLAPSLRVFG